MGHAPEGTCLHIYPGHSGMCAAGTALPCPRGGVPGLDFHFPGSQDPCKYSIQGRHVGVMHGLAGIVSRMMDKSFVAHASYSKVTGI